MKSLMIAFILFTSALAHADLFDQQEAQREAAQAQELHNRMTAENIRLVQGLRRATQRLAPIDTNSAKCSDGWDDRDYSNAVDQACDSQGCFTIYTNDASEYRGILFTCHFNLTDGSECFVQGYSLPHEGFSGRCVDPQLKDHAIDVNVSAPSSGKGNGKTKPKPKTGKKK